jgi:hypothetical protein
MSRKTITINTAKPKYSYIDRNKTLSELINEDNLKFESENKKKIKSIKKKLFVSCSDCELFVLRGTKENKSFGKCSRKNKCIHL